MPTKDELEIHINNLERRLRNLTDEIHYSEIYSGCFVDGCNNEATVLMKFEDHDASLCDDHFNQVSSMLESMGVSVIED